MITQTIMPRVAAQSAEKTLFRKDFMMDLREKMIPQYLVVIFPAAKRDFPMLTVKEVIKTVAKGRITTIKAKAPTRIVIGRFHLPRSTTAGRTDFPDTVI